MRQLLIIAILALYSQVGIAQEGDHLIKWNFKFEKKNLKAGDKVSIICNASIAKDWKLFVSDYDLSVGIKSIDFEFAENGTFGMIKPVIPILEETLSECSQFERTQNIPEKITFRSVARIEENSFEVSGTVRGKLFHEKTGQYIEFQKKFVVQ